jgi:hypothetical protein
MITAIRIFAASAVFSISASLFAPSFCLSFEKPQVSIKGRENIVTNKDVTVYQGATSTQFAAFRKIILQEDWESTKANPSFRKLVRACHEGKNVEQLNAYSRATFWEDLSRYLDKVVQAEIDLQKLWQQGSVGA